MRHRKQIDMDSINMFTKYEKEIQTPDTNNKNINTGGMNGIWHRKMYCTHKEKLKKINDRRTAKSRMNQAWRKGNLQLFGNTEVKVKEKNMKSE